MARAIRRRASAGRRVLAAGDADAAEVFFLILVFVLGGGVVGGLESSSPVVDSDNSRLRPRIFRTAYVWGLLQMISSGE